MADIMEDPEMHDRIIETCKVWLNKEDRLGEIHVSDVMDPRQAVMKRKYGNRMNERQVMLFISGRSYHELIEALVDNNQLNREVEVRWNGIVGHIDATPDGITFEFKSNRGFKVYDIDNISKRYVRNLGYYVAMVNHNVAEAEGILGILYINAKDKLTGAPPLKTYRVRYNDLDAIRFDMLTRKQMIEDAIINTDNLHKLPNCNNGEFGNWSMCDGCLYQECKDL